MRSRVFRPTLFCLLLLAFAGGCSNDPNPKPLRTTRADGSPWQVRHWYIIDDPRSLDPQFSFEQMAHRILEPIYDCLLEYNPFKTDPYEVQPCLLSELPQRLPGANGGVDYLCRLKSGIRFHDDPCFPGGQGREVVAADVRFALQRICDPKVECPVFSALADVLAGFTEAYEEAKKNDGRLDYGRPLAAFEEIDAHTFKLHLTKPYPQIFYWMAMLFLSPVPHEAVAYYDGQPHADGPHGEKAVRLEFKWHPVGTGPYRFVSYTPGQRVFLERNPHYTTTRFPEGGWPPEKEAFLRPLAGHALPMVDEVQIAILRESLPIWLLTRQGYLDLMAVRKDAFNSIITPVHGLTNKYEARGIMLEKDVEPSTYYFSFNMKDPLLGPNKKLRQALSCGFNSQGWIDLFYNGVPTVAEQLLPPGIPGFQKGFRNPYSYNLEKGKKLLVEAGYPNGLDPATGRPLEIKLDVVASGAEERLMAEYEQQSLGQLGVHLEIVENNFARLLEKEDNGGFQVASGTGWGADYPDAENFFFLFYSKNIPPVGKNASRYENPVFDRQFEQMSVMENSPERFKLIAAMNDELVEDCPVIYTFNKAYYVMVQPWAPRPQGNMMIEGTGLKYFTQDGPLRQQKLREWNRMPLWPVLVLGCVVAGLGGYGVVWSRRRHV